MPIAEPDRQSPSRGTRAPRSHPLHHCHRSRSRRHSSCVDGPCVGLRGPRSGQRRQAICLSWPPDRPGPPRGAEGPPVSLSLSIPTQAVAPVDLTGSAMRALTGGPLQIVSRNRLRDSSLGIRIGTASPLCDEGGSRAPPVDGCLNFGLAARTEGAAPVGSHRQADVRCSAARSG